MERYSDEEKNKIRLLVRRLFNKMIANGYTYRQMRPMLRAKSHVTIYRWVHYKTLPSQKHIYHIKKYLGIPVA